MKQINKLLHILILPLAVLLLFTACQNEVNENSKPQAISGVEGVESTEKGITLKGEIKLSGAAPSRSATTSFSDDITWWIMAMAYNPDKNEGVTGSGNDEIENTSVFTITTSNSFSLTLPEAGNWSITINGYAGIYTEETIPLDSQPVFIYNGEPTEYTADANKLTWTIYPSLNPYLTFDLNSDEGVKKGSINLPVTVNVENVYRVSATLAKNQGTDADTIIVEPQPVSNGKVNITVNNVPFGVYTAEISFEDEPGNTLYSCKEAINVYPGLTTDTWFGIAPYFKNGEFVLSANMVEGYGAEPVPSTQIILYDYISDYSGVPVDGNNYYLVDDDNVSNQSSVSVLNSFTNGSGSEIRCFDAEGNLYVLKQAYGEKVLKSNKSGWTDINNNALNNLSIDDSKTCNFVIDLKTNIAYSLYDFELVKTIYKYPNLISSNGTEFDMEDYSVNTDGNMNGMIFTVYNSNAYLLQESVEEPLVYTLYICNLQTNTTQTKVFDLNTILTSLSVPGRITANVSLTDMIYQDGNLYLLYRQRSNSLSSGEPIEIYSRGAVIQYNLLTNTFKTIGLSNNKMQKDSGFKLEAFACQEEKYYPLYQAESYTDKYIPEGATEKYPDLYFPNSATDNQYLYGPSEFIAIRPNELVIFDDGRKFFTQESDDEHVLCFSNVHRVVYIDLKKFEIKATKDINSSLDMGMSSRYITNSESNEYEILEAGDGPYHYNNGETWYEAGDGVSTYLGIPNINN